MSTKIVSIRIQELTIRHNGNFEDEKFAHDDEQQLKNNSLMASLKYPRSGTPNIVVVKQYDLVNGTPATLIGAKDGDPFFDPLLFREEVIDSTVLHLGVSKLDAEGKLSKALIGALAGILKFGFGAATAGLATVFGTIAGLGVDAVTGDLKKSAENNDTLIGEAVLPIDVDQLTDTPAPVRVDFTVPKDVVRARLVVGADHQPRRADVKLLSEGQTNGSITLLVSARPAQVVAAGAGA